LAFVRFDGDQVEHSSEDVLIRVGGLSVKASVVGVGGGDVRGVLDLTSTCDYAG
jgi:hypothetical protein